MNNEKNILARFIQLFKTSGLTKSEFAEKIDVSHQSLNKYLSDENDIQKISIRLFRYGISIDWLYSGKGEPLIGDVKDESLVTYIKDYDYLIQKKRIKNWIEINYKSLVEFEISRDFERYEIQNIFNNDKPIPYLIAKRIENAGCNIHWSMTGVGSSYAENIIGNKLKEKHK